MYFVKFLICQFDFLFMLVSSSVYVVYREEFDVGFSTTGAFVSVVEDNFLSDLPSVSPQAE